jgi:hypothetical protein
LEAERAILLSQALEISSDLTELHARHPELADRFERIRGQLDAPGDGPFAARTPVAT